MALGTSDVTAGDHNTSVRAIAWLGAGLFVAALAYLVYFYAVVLVETGQTGMSLP